MQRSLVAVFRVCPLWGLYAVMAVVILFYMAFNRRGYGNAYRYFRLRFGCSPWRSFCNVYRNHYVFGQVVLDRFATYAGKRFRVEVEGQELFDELEAGDAPFLLLSAHVGNYELAGYTLRSARKRLYALVYAGETETVMEHRERIFRAHNIRMIPVRNDLSHLLLINEALSEGGIIGMPADRLFGSTKSVVCNFLGAEAKFPAGPFAVAVQRGIPALAIFVMKESLRGYRIHVRRLDAPAEGSAKARREALARAYAAELEQILRRYPTQWFNYYDFWA